MSLRLARSATHGPVGPTAHWKDALKAAVDAKERGRNGTVLILGEANSGKSTLIRSLQLHAMGGLNTADADNLYQNTGGAQLTDCAVIPARFSTEPSADYSSTTAACFLLQKKHLCGVLTQHLEGYIRAHGLETMTVLITISVAEMMSAYEQAEDWLTFLVEYITNLVVEADQAKSSSDASLITELTRLKERNARDSDGESDAINLGVQIIVCGCRSDNLPSAIVGQSRQKIAQESIFLAHLRRLCHKFGATLVLINAQEDQHPNCAKLFNMICAPIVGETHTWEAVTDPASRMFIPAGSESEEGLKQLATDVGANFTAPIQTEIEPDYKDDASATEPKINRDVAVPSANRLSLRTFLSRLAASDPSVLEATDSHSEKQSSGDPLVQQTNSHTLRTAASQTAADNTTERRRAVSSRTKEELRPADSQEGLVRSERRRERKPSDRKEVKPSGAGRVPTHELKTLLNSVRGKAKSPTAPADEQNPN